MFVISKILNQEQLTKIKEELKDAEWQDGKLTTSDELRKIKHNRQILDKDTIATIERAVAQSSFVRNSLLLKQFCRVMIVKYEKEMHYGTHSDASVQNGKRADFSFTIFLNDKEDYKGGELVLEDKGKENKVKLDAGDIVIYPSTVLHKVNKVTEGTRLVAVGWVTSHVRNEEHRSILCNLAQVSREIYEKDGGSMPYMKLTQIYNNLMRLWSE